MSDTLIDENEVRRFAAYIAGHPDAEVTEQHLAATRALLGGLIAEGRFVPVVAPRRRPVEPLDLRRCPGCGFSRCGVSVSCTECVKRNPARAHEILEEDYDMARIEGIGAYTGWLLAKEPMSTRWTEARHEAFQYATIAVFNAGVRAGLQAADR
ncbi:hypothetical protein [Micromonospora maritima]|uniref:hypothetical protein n=1 Tax=Micromonospora maritima TaxID=986711 RepID=UPI00157DBF5E|nr:hypothetical protein [Micromonospora maritima]